tara:strand:+ start:162 stop:635 length:474 start_codon:yes stop_codon:yes gene_type:complete
MSESKQMKTFELAEKDKRILEVLLSNSRLSYRAIAKKTGLSTATVINHFQRLKSEGVIKGFTTKIDFEKIGYDTLVLIEIRISHGKLEDVEKKIADNQHVIGMFDVTGEFDAIILARFKDRRSLDYFVKKIQTYENLERTSTRLVFDVVKHEDTPTF